MCVQLLLDYNASAHITNSGGLTASHIALQRGDTALATGIYDIAICSAIIDMNVDDVLTLVGVGGDPNVQCTHNYNFTPLILTAKVGSLSATNILLEHGADPNRAEADSWTPLMFASVRDDLSVVDSLLRAGANVLAVNKRGQSAVDLARMMDKKDILRRLLVAARSSISAGPAENGAGRSKLYDSSSKNCGDAIFEQPFNQGSAPFGHQHSTDGKLLSYSPHSFNLRATRARAGGEGGSHHSTGRIRSGPTYSQASARGRASFREHYHDEHRSEGGYGGGEPTYSLSHALVGMAEEIFADDDEGYDSDSQQLERHVPAEYNGMLKEKKHSIARQLFGWLL